jgi:hypothetical protein
MLAELTRRLKTLHLYGMAAELTEMGVERAGKSEAPKALLQRLVDAESMERQARSIRYPLHVAKFLVCRDLDSFPPFRTCRISLFLLILNKRIADN